MAIFRLRTREYHAAAIARATTEKPRVQIVSINVADKTGSYNVQSRDKKAWYRVEFFKRDGFCFASCTCKNTRLAGCLHPFAAIPHFRMAVGICVEDSVPHPDEPMHLATTADEQPLTLNQRVQRDLSNIATLRRVFLDEPQQSATFACGRSALPAADRRAMADLYGE